MFRHRCLALTARRAFVVFLVCVTLSTGLTANPVGGEQSEPLPQAAQLTKPSPSIHATPQAFIPSICRPAPPEDLGEIPDPTSTATRWIFDDNHFCAAGPPLGCSRVDSNGNLINPNVAGHVNSTGLKFEMYVVADCGKEMHIPLSDVESMCVRVLDSNRNPIQIHATNGIGFDEMGEQVCWNAVYCDGQGSNMPGGPGDAVVMDVSFQGNPTLCGVYIIEFKSWAGCIWDLFANCDGSGTEQFDIYDDLCEAMEATNLLPELVVENLEISKGMGCTVDYCVDVQNIGCVLGEEHRIRVLNFNDQDFIEVPQLEPGEVFEACGNLEVAGEGSETTTVQVFADVDDDLVECSEVDDASSCVPAIRLSCLDGKHLNIGVMG